jgi:hypothetical protein
MAHSLMDLHGFFSGFGNTDDMDGMDLHGFFWDFGTRMTRMEWIYTAIVECNLTAMS